MVAVRAELSHVKNTFKTLSIDDLRHLSTSVLFLSLVRGSVQIRSGHFLAANGSVRIIGWGLCRVV